MQEVHSHKRPKVPLGESFSARLAPPSPQACSPATLQPLANPAIVPNRTRLKSATRASIMHLHCVPALPGTSLAFPSRPTLPTATRRVTPTNPPPTPKDCCKTVLARSTCLL